GPWIPVEDMKVGSADTGGLDADQHFTRAGRGDRDFTNFDTVSGLRLDDGLHGGWHTLEPPLKHQTHKHINRGFAGSRSGEAFLCGVRGGRTLRGLKRWRTALSAWR